MGPVTIPRAPAFQLHGAPRPTSGPTSRLRNRHSRDLRRRPHYARHSHKGAGGRPAALLRRKLTKEAANAPLTGGLMRWAQHLLLTTLRGTEPTS